MLLPPTAPGLNAPSNLLLLFQLSNEVIRRCCASINLDHIFDGAITSSKKSLNECIECCTSWKDLYTNVSCQFLFGTRLGLALMMAVSFLTGGQSPRTIQQEGLGARQDDNICSNRRLYPALQGLDRCKTAFCSEIMPGWAHRFMAALVFARSATVKSTLPTGKTARRRNCRSLAARRGPRSRNLAEIESTFNRHLMDLRRVKNSILDVKATTWHEDYNK